VLREVQEENGERYLQERFAEFTDQERQAMVGEFVARIRDTGRYPHMTELIEAGIDPDAAESREARFEFGLNCLLDGIETRLPRPPARTPAAAG
jgi:hypothetical protein